MNSDGGASQSVTTGGPSSSTPSATPSQDTLLATFGELHPACDHWVQGSKTASRKRMYGKDLVHADGTPATPDSTRPTTTTSTLGRRAVACHVASVGLVT
ncbi:hypothetical protein ACF08E_33460 [Streptomyces globisporus]|uniref:hypothetical protein n=1 Tax=Streptomyces globisporus TaxID=1908 RepID=UPI0036F56A4B